MDDENQKLSDNNFRTPEQIASIEDRVPEKRNPLKRSILNHPKLSWINRLTKKQKIIIVVVAVLVIAGLAFGIYKLVHHKAPTLVKHAVVIVKAKPKSLTVASNLTGLQVLPAVNSRPVTGVMIENSDAARPQSGLSEAGVVFEAVAEGGVTRFLALYQDNQPSSIGPIRSLRPYYLSWDMGFDAPIAHVGGSPDALADVQSWGAENLDEFYNGSYYTRITSREAPHNVYTSIAELNALETSKGYTSSVYTSFPRKADSPSASPTATTIGLVLSGSDYNASYSYDKTTNSYNRSEGGATQTDLLTGTQISPKVVIAIVVPESQGALDASGAYYSDYSFIGSGQVDVFQDGIVTVGTWQKTSNTSQITFTNSNGSPIKLNAGQTWITAVSESSAISYSK